MTATILHETRIPPQTSAATSPWEVEVFYDGDCPLCVREIAMLRRWDKRSKIRFTDIAEADFDPVPLGKTYPQLMDEIHGRLPDGSWIIGVEVFRRLYAAVGFGWAMSLTRVPGISHLLNLGYYLFAKNRLRLTGRCSAETCSVKKQNQSINRLGDIRT